MGLQMIYALGTIAYMARPVQRALSIGTLPESMPGTSEPVRPSAGNTRRVAHRPRRADNSEKGYPLRSRRHYIL